MLVGHFCPPWSGSGSKLRHPDPETPVYPDPIRILIHNIGYNPWQNLPDGRGGEGGALHGRDGRSPEVALDEGASQLITLVPVLRVSRHHVPAQVLTISYTYFAVTSVADPDPPDQHIFGPPGSGSGSTNQRYGSGSVSGFGSGSFYHHAKIIRKTLNPTILWLFLTFNLWKMM